MRVLVVEHEVHLARTIRRGLAAEGIEAELVHNGLDGLWRARERPYAAIILDLLLPGMNGFEVCRTLRAEGVWTPVLMLTAKDGEYDEAEGLDLGADDYLAKPFSFVVLVARLRVLARRGAVASSAVLAAGDLSLDTTSRVCRRDGTVVALTPREAALLEALLSRAGEVVTKRDLLREVWGDDVEVDPNVVEVYVGYLRRKIDVPFGCRSLQTVRGFGYRLVPSGPEGGAT
jgi:DNA-binding response OmpR family regulator